MFKISQHNRDLLIKYFDNSNLPHGDVKEICKMLGSLEEIKPDEIKPEEVK